MVERNSGGWWDEGGVVVCTGAGISVASGLATFRGVGGLYETRPDIALLSDVNRVAESLSALWAFWGPWRAEIAGAAPNPAHTAVTELEQRRADVTLITMNVDGLHQRSGSVAPVEVHGNLFRSSCVRACGVIDWDDAVAYTATPSCPSCEGPARPALVLFGEQLPPEAAYRAKRSVRSVDVFLAVGTSGTVSTSDRLAAGARYAGARMIWVNVEPPARPGDWTDVVLGPAEHTLPEVLAALT